MANFSLRQFNQHLLETGLFSDLIVEIKKKGISCNKIMSYYDTAEYDKINFTITDIRTFENGELDIDNTVLISDLNVNYKPFIGDLIDIKYYYFDEFEHSYMLDKEQIGNELIAVIGLNSKDIHKFEFDVKQFKSYISKVLSDEDFNNIYCLIFDMFDLTPIRRNDGILILNDDQNFKSIVYKCNRIPKNREKLFAIINKGKKS
ncbi:Uncharacterised protein [Campylobacter hyointestinalis subsp. hyointestinalis]|uniref:Uncharacterized protein n=1 Tax=Campylobacter hyointestinalis subsp. hyointestinalis TaxID=91352 RepID=A0A0S4SV49_CAMHY|nr:hypothetical protein [Campylobacter hyointestinalis]CUU89641.1 Uncharacterised protein [Campylobacter hyointestinalis subsp. hyointestinalis]